MRITVSRLVLALVFLVAFVAACTPGTFSQDAWWTPAPGGAERAAATINTDYPFGGDALVQNPVPGSGDEHPSAEVPGDTPISKPAFPVDPGVPGDPGGEEANGCKEVVLPEASNNLKIIICPDEPSTVVRKPTP